MNTIVTMKSVIRRSAGLRSARMIFIGSTVVVCVSAIGLTAKLAETKGATDASERCTDPIPEDELRRIAAEYKHWGRVDETPRWAPELCAPGPKENVDLVVGPSASPHAQKLYYLFAADAPAYTVRFESPQPDGQVLVKENFDAMQVDAAPGKRGKNDHSATRDGESWMPGSPRALFVMRRYPENDRGSAHGWRYATMSHDGSIVFSNGNSTNCIECHDRAPHHGLFRSR